jgi:carbonic anhydrase/acetyltransferase-like protein (isoleucine patch superfamily)
MTSIRGDEGVPITIGPRARIGNRVTFHALKGQSIEIGEHLVSGDGVVFHGALSIGNQVTVGDNTVLFKSTVGSGSSIGKGAIIIGARLAENSSVPDGALVLNQVEADQYSPQDNRSS